MVVKHKMTTLEILDQVFEQVQTHGLPVTLEIDLLLRVATLTCPIQGEDLETLDHRFRVRPKDYRLGKVKFQRGRC